MSLYLMLLFLFFVSWDAFLCFRLHFFCYLHVRNSLTLKWKCLNIGFDSDPLFKNLLFKWKGTRISAHALAATAGAHVHSKHPWPVWRRGGMERSSVSRRTSPGSLLGWRKPLNPLSLEDFSGPLPLRVESTPSCCSGELLQMSQWFPWTVGPWEGLCSI